MRIIDLARVWRSGVHEPARLLERVAAGLRQADVTWPSLRAELADLTEAERNAMLLRSRETSSHVKWSLFRESHNGFAIWLHDYRKWSGGERFAGSTHDHRYGFASKILSGGYTEQRWPGRLPGRAVRRDYTVGEVNVVDADTVHRVASVLPGTMTVVLQMPKSRISSTTYRRDGDELYGPVQEIVDLECRFDGLVSTTRQHALL